jgi:hypothetical protein
MIPLKRPDITNSIPKSSVTVLQRPTKSKKEMIKESFEKGGCVSLSAANAFGLALLASENE